MLIQRTKNYKPLDFQRAMVTAITDLLAAAETDKDLVIVVNHGHSSEFLGREKNYVIFGIECVAQDGTSQRLRTVIIEDMELRPVTVLGMSSFEMWGSVSLIDQEPDGFPNAQNIFKFGVLASPEPHVTTDREKHAVEHFSRLACDYLVNSVVPEGGLTFKKEI